MHHTKSGPNIIPPYIYFDLIKYLPEKCKCTEAVTKLTIAIDHAMQI